MRAQAKQERAERLPRKSRPAAAFNVLRECWRDRFAQGRRSSSPTSGTRKGKSWSGARTPSTSKRHVRTVTNAEDVETASRPRTWSVASRSRRGAFRVSSSDAVSDVRAAAEAGVACFGSRSGRSPPSGHCAKQERRAALPDHPELRADLESRGPGVSALASLMSWASWCHQYGRQRLRGELASIADGPGRPCHVSGAGSLRDIFRDMGGRRFDVRTHRPARPPWSSLPISGCASSMSKSLPETRADAAEARSSPVPGELRSRIRVDPDHVSEGGVSPAKVLEGGIQMMGSCFRSSAARTGSDKGCGGPSPRRGAARPCRAPRRRRRRPRSPAPGRARPRG